MNKLILIAILSIISVFTVSARLGNPERNLGEYAYIGETELGLDTGAQPGSEVPTPSTLDTSATNTTNTTNTTDTGGETGATGFEADCLNAHNTERTALGIAPLTYSADLAATAQQWANVIAGENNMHHSKNRGNVGENLAFGTTGIYDTTKLIGLWIKEKKDFINGVWPHVSTTGSWEDVGHYTQMIWSTTTEVGCATADSSKCTYIVCHYSPAGNIIGDKAY